MQTLYSVSELAERWGYAPDTIRRMEADGIIHRIPNLPGVRFCLEEIERYDTMMALGQEVKNHTPYEWRKMEAENRELKEIIAGYEKKFADMMMILTEVRRHE